MNLPNVSIKKILYATDLSETSVHAYSYACSFAAVYNASITMIHVVAETASTQFISTMISPQTLKDLKSRHYSEAKKNLIGKKREFAKLKDVLQAFSDEAQATNHNNGNGADEILIKDGPPAETIVETSLEERCDLIVMGTHGQSGITEFMTGSTAKKVISQSTVPVLVVRFA